MQQIHTLIQTSNEHETGRSDTGIIVESDMERKFSETIDEFRLTDKKLSEIIETVKTADSGVLSLFCWILFVILYFVVYEIRQF